ncbi:MAG: hypothetical protein NTU89_00395 [Candidatus Dependentiae bacterium]|nr:hypothetical protein [Candidatus Dependentiae bacterium]
MVKQFQLCSKKIIFNFFVASFIFNSFQLSLLVASERKLSLKSDPGFDSDEEEERLSGQLYAQLLKSQYIEPSSGHFYQDDQGHVFRRRTSPLSEDDQDGQDELGFLFLPPAKIKKTVKVLRKSDKVSSSAQSTNAFKFASTVFPDVATKRSPFRVTDSRSNKTISKELTSLPWQVGPQLPARVHHAIPKPPSLLEKPINNMSEKDAIMARALALPEKKESPRVGTDFGPNRPLSNHQSDKSPRRVSFISSSDIDLSHQAVNDSYSKARKVLSTARELDNEFLQRHLEDEK